MQLLARDGLAGCTARAVADASPLTKSAIHYYFRDIDEIVDAAVAAHLDAMLAGLREVAREHADPDERLRAVIVAYLDTFVDRPHAAFLWFEHWIAAGRRGEPASVEAMLTAVEALFDELLAARIPRAGAIPARWCRGCWGRSWPSTSALGARPRSTPRSIASSTPSPAVPAAGEAPPQPVVAIRCA